jgi:acetyl-CoA carboxylase biotin carboxylase subunit
MFRKILIANRGEIAIRVLRACHELGIAAVAVYSDADRASLHVRLADEAYPIGPAASRESYLRIDKLMEVAARAGCDALHPGYGFLAENPALARACASAGVVFIGPAAEAMEKLGSKTAARQLASEAQVATVPGTLDPLASAEQAAEFAREAGYPVVLKAVAGGGGKGMRRVNGAAELEAAWRDASSEAANAFGDPRLYVEKFLARPRHIEIQVLGDQHGRVVSLGERECSVQRRHQKVIEESPSPVVDAALRRRMGEAAVRLARAGGYSNAGTLEFLVGEPAGGQREFYFLEMNTRLQVEHPVTEMVTGLDLVKLQIRIAAGEPLPFANNDFAPRGHAIECRVYAEDPENNFFPSPGTILARRTPAGPGVRVDEGIYPGWTVPTEYDPLLGKLIVWAGTREEAIARLRRALEEYYVTGIQTNIPFFRRILNEPEFVAGDIHTNWLDELLQRSAPAAVATRKPESQNHAEDAAILAAALWHISKNGTREASAAPPAPPLAGSRWRGAGRREQLDRTPRR